MLSHGAFSGEVVGWQTFLRLKGYCNWQGDALAVTGEFDDDTEYATRCFQRDHGLRQTGTLCPTTERLARALGWRGGVTDVKKGDSRRWTS